MKLRHAAQVLTLAALAACGSEARVEQPPGCDHALERVPETPEAGDVRVGDAWFGGLQHVEGLPWREHWLADEGYAFFKVGLTVPAGGTLMLSVPPEARGLVTLDYSPEDEAEGAVSLSACHGNYAVVPFYGGFKVKRPLCRVPLDWRYGERGGRLHLTFGDACD